LHHKSEKGGVSYFYSDSVMIFEFIPLAQAFRPARNAGGNAPRPVFVQTEGS
jgi:hypothetical protein